MGLLLGTAGINDAVSVSTTVATSLKESWMPKDSRGTRRRGEEAVPRKSPGSSSWQLESGIVYRPEETKPFWGLRGVGICE